LFMNFSGGGGAFYADSERVSLNRTSNLHCKVLFEDYSKHTANM